MIRISIKEKVQAKLADDLIGEEDSVMLEAQDVLDMKVVIKGEMELSNNNLGAI